PDELATLTARVRGVADAIASSFAVHTARNRLTHRARMPHPVSVLAGRRLVRGFLTSTPELAALAALPQDLAVPGLDRAHAKPMPAPGAVPTGGRGVTVLGDAEIGGHPVGLAVPDARYHVHMVGSTGSRKTTLLANVTLQHIPPLLNSPQFRSAMTVDLDDPDGLAGFWQWYDDLSPALRSQVIGPVLARLRAFLLRDFVKRTMRYPKSSFDMGRVLDGGILLVRIPKGQLGEDTSRLLGSLILARVWQAATARAAIGIDA